MGSQLLASKVVVVEEKPSIRGIPSLATAVLALVGVTERGPVATPVQVTSPEEYDAVFGGYDANGDITPAVLAFFANGGTQAWVSRVVHCTTPGDPTTKTSAPATLTLQTAASSPTSGSVTGANVEPFDLEPADTLVVAVNGGGPATATITATAAARENTPAETYALVNNQTLTVKVDGGAAQTITFTTSQFVAIGAATAEEVAAAINGQIVGAQATVTSGGTKVTITSDRRGTGSHIEVTGGSANAVLTFNTAVVNGTGNVANVDAVTFAELKTIVEAAVAGCTVTSVAGAVKISSNTTGPTSSVQVQASSTADDELGLDNATHTGGSGAAAPTLTVAGKYDGTYGNGLSVIVSAATNGDAGHFNLAIVRDGAAVESFSNLSMDEAAADYAVTVVNASGTGSNLVALTDLAATADPPVPATGTFGPLTGGNDGLGSLADADFTGAVTANGRTGIRALDIVQEVTLLAIPGRATAAVHNAMVTWCEVTRDGSAFAILDPPAAQSRSGIVTYVKSTALLQGLSEYAAIYWPRVKILNPIKDVYGDADQITVPPSGHIAGMFARVDASGPGGVFQAPAGIDNGRLFGVLALETDEVKDEATRDIVFPELINPISVEPGTPIFVDGARTLKADGNWPTIGERRGVIFIESSLKRGLASARHRNINPRLIAEVGRSTKAFLLGLTKAEAFASTDPKLAFFVDVGPGVNTPTTALARQVVEKIGLATAKPAEWVILKISPDTRALDEELAAA